MSQFAVKMVRVSEVREHPNADALELAMIEGSLYQVVVQKGSCQPGDVRLYVPLDAVIPVAVSDAWSVTKYLSKGRVRAARLRGETSYGFLADSGSPDDVGSDLTDYYGITKYEPPMTLGGEQAPPIDAFHKYTDIENIHNFPGLIEDGEEVVVTEKLHGTNSRVGHVLVDGEPTFVCGSHNLRLHTGKNSAYEMPLLMESVKALLEMCIPKIEDGNVYGEVVLFGEIYGAGVQKGFNYGEQKPEFRAFDISLDGRYVDWSTFSEACVVAGVPIVPVLYEGPFNADVISELVSGPTTMGGDHIREGVVIRPVVERLNQQTGRTILKWKSDDYLVHKHGG